MRERDRKRKRKRREEIQKMRAQREAGIMERATKRVVSGQSRQTRDQQMCAASGPHDRMIVGLTRDMRHELEQVRQSRDEQRCAALDSRDVRWKGEGRTA